MKNITSQKLRIILIASLFLLAALGVAIFLLGFGEIKKFAVTTQETSAQAAESNSSLQKLVAVKKVLENEQDTVTRAKELVAESKSYLYQDQIINDINRFAGEADLSINNISFTPTATTATPGVAQAPPSANAAPAAPAPAGIKSTTASVTLNNPINYTQLLRFINLIEQSLFRMQISQLSLSKAEEGDAVTTNALTIEVFLR